MELKVSEKEIEYKPIVQDDGTVKLKKKSKIARGSKSKAAGGQFELRVRKDLEEKGWIVDKWSNNLDLEENKIVPCKRKTIPLKYGMAGIKGNPFIRMISTVGTGFPDFIAFQKMENGLFKIIGVEVKMNGTLSRIEKEKCEWYLKNGIFSEILIAGKGKEKNRVRVEYVDVEEILKKMKK